MTDIIPFLKDLLSTAGLSGYEDPAAAIIETKWKSLVNEMHRGKTGSLMGLRRGTLPGDRPSLMIAAHMDAIGLMVTQVVDGFLRITSVGGIDPRVLPGTQIILHASGTGSIQTIPGVIVQPFPDSLPQELIGLPVPLEYLFIDTGLPARRLSELVQVGDLASFSQPPSEMSGSAISGHTLDNRASVAALTVCLEELQSRSHLWDLWAVATSQEETGMIGAKGSAFEVRPSLAIAVDVTFAKGPGASDWLTSPLGKGPTLCMGPNIHPALYKAMKDLADKLEIPHTPEVAPRHTGTDAFATQIIAEGIPSLVMGIPLRYMHTPVEVVSIRDIQRAGRLLAEFMAGLDEIFLGKITWDD